MKKLNIFVSLIYAFVSWALNAQIRQLTTDSAGRVLYFSAKLNVADAEPRFYSKIFKWDENNGVRTFLQREYLLGPSSGRFNSALSNFYDLESPSVSSDGNLIAVIGHQDCSGCITGFTQTASSEVTFIEPDGTEVAHWNTPDARSTVKVSLSRNGQFFYTRYETDASFGRLYDARSKVSLYGPLSLSSVPYAAIGTRQMAADNGAATFVDKNSVLVLANGPRAQDQISLASAGPAMAPVINAKATTIIYESLYAGGEPGALYAYDIASRRKTLLFFDPTVHKIPIPIDRLSNIVPTLHSPPYIPLEIPSYGASIDDNGTNVLAMVREASGLPRQWLFLVKSDGSDPTWLGYVPEGYREAIISGNGKVAFAVTEWSRLLRYDLDSGESTELLPRTPWVQDVYGAGRPGAANHIIGGGFTAESFTPDSYPASTELGGVRVEYLGQHMPLLKVTPTEIVYQIPWEFPSERPIGVDGILLKIFAPSNSPFAMPPPGHSYPTPQQFEMPGPLHEDGTPVNLYNPVRAGEVLRLYATGFDNPKGTTGQVELGPRAASNDDLTCIMGDPYKSVIGAPVELLYFGLAVGKAGVYEIRLRVPPEFKVGSYLGFIRCQNSMTNPYMEIDVPVRP